MQSSLFETGPGQPGEPLAARMRPRTLGEFVGQAHLLGPGRALRRLIETGRIGSIVLWGPPGIGKTSLALLIVQQLDAHHELLSAVSAGVAELRRIVEAATKRLRSGGRTVVIVDEVHRWSKSQQDGLLPHVEAGTILLIGLTSENPYFDLIPALRSRLRIIRLEPLARDDLRALLERAVADPERGLGARPLHLERDALDLLIDTSGGDARTALNGLEAAAAIAAPHPDGVLRIDRACVQEAIGRRNARYDRAGDDHYQTASAFIKSMRGSDPDAAVFYLAKMLAAGEEPRFIARRIVILASEDIGNADPQALVLAEAAARAVEHVGLPEAGYALAQACLYMATAPKSNAAARALWAAQRAVESGANLEVPMHLRNASFGGARALGWGQGYEYSHDYAPDDPGRYRQRYLPDGVNATFYEPSDVGHEATIKQRLDAWRRSRAEVQLESDTPGAERG